MLNIGWFSTGRGEGSRGLLQFVQERIQSGLLDARIQFVFSNRSLGEAEGSDEFFKLVSSYDLALVTCSSAQFRRSRRTPTSPRTPWAVLRPDFDRLALAALAGYQPDVCILAGYMLILSDEMHHRYPFLNLHPALPDGPIGTWQEVTWELIRQRGTLTGAMIHLATEALDRGPVVSYCTVPIAGVDFEREWQALEGLDLDSVRASLGEEFPLFQQIRRAQYIREPYLILETLRAIGEGRVVITDGKALNSAGEPLSTSIPPGICLDAEINAAMVADGLS